MYHASIMHLTNENEMLAYSINNNNNKKTNKCKRMI